MTEPKPPKEPAATGEEPTVESEISEEVPAKQKARAESAVERPQEAVESPAPGAAPPGEPPPASPGGGNGDGGEEDEEEEELGGKMTFLEHLDELRRRILYSLLSVVVTFTGAWVFREEIFGFLSQPIHDVIERLVVIKPTEPFTIYLKVSFTAAVFLAIPFILLQVWLFVAPGLYRREKRFALPFLIGSTILFVLGGLFAYYIVLPPALRFLLLEFGRNFQPMISAVDFFDFELLIILGMGVIFQLPILVAFLSLFGLVTPGFLWRNFRYAFLIITIIAAVVSPTTDPFNLFLWSGPMVILYTLSIGISWIFKRRRDARERVEGEERWRRS
ncbi:MAG: hypothetical protein Kow00109_07790 [Acidobacteriota bacterium]